MARSSLHSEVTLRGLRRAIAPTLALAAALVLAAPALAHEFWLSPSSYRAHAGDTVSVSAYVGTGFRGEIKPYAPTRALRFTVRGSKEADLRRGAVNGDLVMARFVAVDGGGALVAYESDFAAIQLPAADFDAYLKLEGLDEPLRIRQKMGAGAGPGRERYARCPKAWIAGAEAARALRPAGLPIEIVPLQDPTVASEISMRVLLDGKPLAGALVRAWNRPLGSDLAPRDPAARDSVGPVFAARTDAKGLVTLRSPGPGEWMVSAVHMAPCTNRLVADWESRWASLTFARAGR